MASQSQQQSGHIQVGSRWGRILLDFGVIITPPVTPDANQLLSPDGSLLTSPDGSPLFGHP